MKIKLAFVALVSAFSMSAQAAAVFSDDFNSYSGDLNWVPQGGWAVSNGTVDLIGYSTPWNFFPPDTNNRYIDLDGSTGAAGLLSHSINLLAGTSYTLSFNLAGSQRTGYDINNIVDVTFGGNTTSFTLNTADPFSPYTLNYTPLTLADATNVIFSFHNHGGDNVGALLDNVSINAVPEPETYAMLLAGLGLMGFVARRKNNQV